MKKILLSVIDAMNQSVVIIGTFLCLFQAIKVINYKAKMKSPHDSLISRNT